MTSRGNREPDVPPTPTAVVDEHETFALDHRFFPHIIDEIWRNVDSHDAWSYRLVSEDWYLRAIRAVLRHVAVTQAPNGIRLTPVVRKRPDQRIRFWYDVVFRSAVIPESPPIQDEFTISLVKSIRTVDIETPVCDEYAFQCRCLLRRLHELGELETVRLRVREGQEITTYGSTQILHMTSDEISAVQLSGAETIILNIVSDSPDTSPILSAMGTPNVWFYFDWERSADTLKSIIITFEHEFDVSIDGDLRTYAGNLWENLRHAWHQAPTTLVGLEEVFQHEEQRNALREQIIHYPKLLESEMTTIPRNLHLLTRQEYEALVGSETYALHTQMP